MKLSKKIEEFVGFLWILIMFNPIIAYITGYLPTTPSRVLELTLLSVIIFGAVGILFSVLYLYSKDVAEQIKEVE